MKTAPAPSPPRHRHRARRRVRWLRLLLVVGVLGALLVGGLRVVDAFLGSTQTAAEPVQVVIPEGVGAGGVADILHEAGVISNATLFRAQARFDERASRIIPGTYELTPGMSTGEILEVISTPPPSAPTFRVTIPEGLTVEQTLKRIAKATDSPFSAQQLAKALGDVALPAWVPTDLPAQADPFEGLLFPNTYEFKLDATPQDVLGQLVAQTEKVLEGVAAPKGLSPYEVLVIASLIEREARLRDEQPKISSVIHNRLDEGIPLQIDATVLYALGEHKPRVLYSDLEVDSPWNTYKYPGLPPTPISASGQAAIEAAADPADTKFLYYVVVDPETGEHAFSETYEEFLRNRDRARADQG